jgi:hypothetical protein
MAVRPADDQPRRRIAAPGDLADLPQKDEGLAML